MRLDLCGRPVKAEDVSYICDVDQLEHAYVLPNGLCPDCDAELHPVAS